MVGSGDSAKAQMYQQLASMERAGLPLLQSLSRLTQGSTGRMLEPVRLSLDKGEDIASAFKAAPGFTRLESAIIASGAAGGTLPESFTQLAELFEDRSRMKMKMAMSLAYPLLLLHAAIFLPSMGTLVADRGGLGPYLLETLVPLLGIYVAVGGTYGAYRFLRAGNPRLLDRLLLSVPVLGSIVRKGSLAIGLKALSILYGNGVPILKGLELSGETCPNRCVGDVFERVAEAVSQGDDVGLAFATEGAMVPGQVIDLISTGSTSGHLDEMLESASKLMDEQASTARTMMVVALGGVVFALVVVLIAYRVISFYGNLYSDTRLNPF